MNAAAPRPAPATGAPASPDARPDHSRPPGAVGVMPAAPVGRSTQGGADFPAGDEGPAPAVTPFWQRMPQLFLFPLQRAPLLRNLGATIAFTLVLWVGTAQYAGAPFRWGLTIFLAGAGAFLYTARYAFLVVERSAAGYLDSRGYPQQEAGPNWWRPVKMFLVLVLVPMAIVLFGNLLLPKFLVLAALLIFAALLPASVMVLTMTDSFADAVNPAHGLRTATNIGPPYLLLCLFLFMLYVSSGQAIGFLLHGLGAPPAPAGTGAAPAAIRGNLGAFVFVITLVENYFLVLMCALIGYTMYQYSAALGIAVVGPGEARRAGPISAAAHERRVREAMIGKLIATGELREAMELISDEMRLRPADLSLHVRMHTLLLHEGSRPRIEAHAERYLELLLAASNFKDALALYEQTQAMFPAFAPRDPARLPQLAAAAIDALKPDVATQLVRGFDRKYPGHPSVPDVYVIGARIMLLSEHAAEARRLLEYVTATYGATPAAAEARRYLARFAPAPSE